MSLIHLARQGFITKSALPNVTRQRGTTTGTANLMVYGAGKTFAIGTNTTFTDSSTNNFTVTRNGDTIQATNNPFTGSVYFDGNGDYLTVPANSGFQFGTGNFTVEFWLNYSSLTNAQTIISSGYVGGTVAGGWIVQTGIGDGKVNLYFQNAINAVLVAADSGSTVLAGNWYHIAIVKNGSTVTIYRNGQSVGSGTDSNNYNANSILVIGGGSSSGYNNYWVNGYISNLRIVKGTAVYTANFSVPTSPLTAITNTSLLLLTAQQGPFRDSSTNNFTVTANGNAAGNGLEPFPVNYAGSAYLDGTGDYLSVANNVALQMGTGVFTIEAWIYRNAAGAAHTIYCKGGASTGMVLQVTATNVLRFIDTTTNIDSTGTIAATTWTHVAVVRSGTGTNETKLYINGTQDGQGTVTTDFNQTEESRIGTNRSAGENFAGYISNVRVVKGTAVYTAAFTPPTVPLTAVTNTSLLLLTNNVGPFVDNGPNGFPILRNGDTVQTGFSPFTGQPSAGSGYFDGTGDELFIPSNSAFAFGTGAYTIEFWVYQTVRGIGNTGLISVIGSNVFVFYIQSNGILGNWTGFFNNTSTTIPLNTWTHIAAVRQSGGQLNFYVNGASVFQSTNTVNYDNSYVRLGFDNVYLTGYLSNIRIVKGTALYTSNFTPATAPLPAVPNTSLLLNTDNYRIANSTSTYLPITINGDATVSTAQFPTGMDRSMYFDGNGDYLRIPDNSVVELGANNFTIEMFVNFSSLPPSSLTYSYFISKWASAQGAYNFQLSNVSNLYYLNFDYSTNGNNGFQLSVPWTPSVSTWYHIALVRNSTNLLFFVNGTQQGSTQTISATINNSNAAFVVGAYLESVNFFHGYMSNLRLTVGSALYTANFTPPSLPMSISVTVPAYVTNNIYGVYQLA
jgi:hypothetical protein